MVDHTVVRKGLAMVLRLESDIEVIGEAENGRTGLETALRLDPDIALADLVMPEMDFFLISAAYNSLSSTLTVVPPGHATVTSPGSYAT